jgi:hypothetical protein
MSRVRPHERWRDRHAAAEAIAPISEIVLALARLVPVSARAATIIIDDDTIDIVRIRIVQIDTPTESHVRFLISIRRRS